MSSAILIFAGPEDDAELRAYAESVGLALLHPHAHGMTAEENARSFDDPIQGGYFSFLPVSRLSRRPHPSIGLCDVLDPLLFYVRPHYQAPLLVAGQIIQNTDVEALARQTRPYFHKLRLWVQSNWRLRKEDRYYVGPHAERILGAGAKIAYLPPNVTVRTVIID